MIMTIVRKYTRCGDLLKDTCVITLSTAKICLMLPCHRRYVRCDINGECIKEATTSLVLVSTKQVHNPDSVIQVLDMLKLACTLYIAAEGLQRVNQGREF